MLKGELKALNAKLKIPGSLKEAGITEESFSKVLEQMTDDAMKSGNIAVNPRKTERSDILKLYKETFQEKSL